MESVFQNRTSEEQKFKLKKEESAFVIKYKYFTKQRTFNFILENIYEIIKFSLIILFSNYIEKEKDHLWIWILL